MNVGEFFTGFCKRASESPTVISEWLAQAAEASKKAKSKKPDKKVDPRDLGEWQAPETWHRYWP